MPRKSKPHLLFVYPNQFGYHTDTYKYCEYLQDSFQISYFCFDQGLPKTVLNGINLLYNPYYIGKAKRLIRFYYQAIKYAKEIKCDILFVVQFKFCFLLGLFVKARVKILDYRTGDLSYYRVIRYLKNKLMWFDSLFFDHISSISEGLRDILNLSRVKTLILPIGGDVLSTQVHSFDHLDLIYIGSLNKRNIYQTIEGIAVYLERAKAIVIPITYTIIGFGNKNEIIRINKTINKYNLGKIVTFMGRVKYSELSKYFDQCNIGVAYIPKKPYYEHQPATKTFEYIISGLFTIATSTFENSNVINEQNGILCDDSPESFSQALEVVYDRRQKINDPDIRATLKNFSWERIVNTILEPYLKKLIAV